MCRGYLDDRGATHLAQVAHLIGPGGRDDGWMIWLVGHRDVLDVRPPTAEEAMHAAELALDDGPRP
jgi:hypothetical protein